MRSILKFLLYTAIIILVPTLGMSIGYYLDLNEVGLFIIQMLLVLLFILVFSRLIKAFRAYEVKTAAMADNTREVSKLRELRDERYSYRSKALITSKILTKDFSKEEAENLKKYSTKKEDFDHYFSALIDNSKGAEREAYRVKRDNFNKRYANKINIYPNFTENVKTTGKWIAFFLILALIYNRFPVYFLKNEINIASFFILGMFILAAVMINTILWIGRTLNSYWNKDLL